MLTDSLLTATFVSPFVLYNVRSILKTKRLLRENFEPNDTLQLYKGYLQNTIKSESNLKEQKDVAISSLNIYAAKKTACGSKVCSHNKENVCFDNFISIDDWDNKLYKDICGKLALHHKLTKYRMDKCLTFKPFIIKNPVICFNPYDIKKITILQKKPKFYESVTYTKIIPGIKEYLLETYIKHNVNDSSSISNLLNKRTNLYYTESVISVDEPIYLFRNTITDGFVVSTDYKEMFKYIQSTYYYKISFKLLIILIVIAFFFADYVYGCNREFFDGVDVCDKFYRKELS